MCARSSLTFLEIRRQTRPFLVVRPASALFVFLRSHTRVQEDRRAQLCYGKSVFSVFAHANAKPEENKRATTFDYIDRNDALLFVDRCPRLVRGFTFCASKEDYLGKTIDFVYSTFLLTVITANAAT
jgi:hypothetical protein